MKRKGTGKGLMVIGSLRQDGGKEFLFGGRNEAFAHAHFEILTASEVDDKSATDETFHISRHFVAEASHDLFHQGALGGAI